jgi:predicted DNA-binding protein with PD1-like motif
MDIAPPRSVSCSSFSKIVFARLGPRSDLMLGIKAVCREHGIKCAVILSCIGSLEKVTFGYAKLTRNKAEMLSSAKTWCSDTAVSMLSAQGVVAPDLMSESDLAVHLHGSFMDNNGKVVGQHIEDIEGGAIVFNTAEIVLGEVDLPIVRRFDEEVSTPIFTPA